MNDVAKIGHNNPPDPLDEAIAPYGDAIEEAGNWLDGEPVQTEEQMKAVDALLRDIKEAEKAAKAAEEAEAKPLHDAWKAAKARYKPTLDDLARLKKGLAGVMDAFKRKLAQEKAEAQRKAREEAEAKRRAAEEAARAAQETDIEAQRAAAQAQQEAEDAQRQAVAASKEQVKGLRTVTRYEIEDHRAALHWIVREDRDAMVAFIEDYVRRHHKTASIEGVRVWTEREAF
ncbi:MAG: hypothetical protein ACQEUZ_06285 [Pseudomonadota bacterium]